MRLESRAAASMIKIDSVTNKKVRESSNVELTRNGIPKGTTYVGGIR